MTLPPKTQQFMRYFTITFATTWPNGKFHVGSVAYENEIFPTFKQCFDSVNEQTASYPTSILSVTEYSKSDWETFLSELP